MRKVIEPVWMFFYHITIWLLYPLNYLLLWRRRAIKYDNSVLHVSYMVHIPYYTVKILRDLGMKADYLAIGTSKVWDQCDYQKPTSIWPPVQAFQEFLFFWQVMAKYEVIHSHFMVTVSKSGWELPILQRLGRRLVIHHRGCNSRDRDKNMQLHPAMNICQQCDYNAVPCTSKTTKQRRRQADYYGDLHLVTTPDLIDFVPKGVHLPFFTPEINAEDYLIDAAATAACRHHKLKIVHVTNHPGIEGTAEIEAVINRLKAKGYALDFVFLKEVSPEQVLREYANADLTIGKMKMGYYANAQIESMFLGVPAVTYVRSEFMTEALQHSGFIFSSLSELEKTLEYYLQHPEKLAEKRQIARSSIMTLHDNEKLGKQLIQLYHSLQR